MMTLPEAGQRERTGKNLPACVRDRQSALAVKGNAGGGGDWNFARARSASSLDGVTPVRAPESPRRPRQIGQAPFGMVALMLSIGETGTTGVGRGILWRRGRALLMTGMLAGAIGCGGGSATGTGGVGGLGSGGGGHGGSVGVAGAGGVSHAGGASGGVSGGGGAAGGGGVSTGG